MRNPFRRPHGIPSQELSLVDKFQCEHAITTFQYGTSPMRVYALCGQHKQYMLLDWKDPRARLSNRIVHTFPFLYSATLTFGAMFVIAYVLYYSFVHH